jgi:hypothetical protein
MATPLEQMVIEIKADTGNLQAEMTKVKAQLESVGSTAKRESENTKGFAGALKSLAGATAGFIAFAEVTKFFSEAGHAAVDNSKSLQIMALTMKNATGAGADQVEQTNKQIEALSSMSGVLASNIRPAFDILVRSTHDSSKALAMQKLALDVSAATGKDVSTVSMAMAKAYEGSNTALNRLVPSVKNSTDKFGDLQKQMGGAAQKAADADPYKRMSVALEQMQIVVGNALMPIMKALVPVVQSLSPVFVLLAKGISSLVPIILPLIKQVFPPLIQLTQMLMKTIMPLAKDLMVALMPAFVSLIKVIEPLLRAVLPPLVLILEKVLIPILKMFSGELSDYLVPMISNLTNFLRLLGDVVSNTVVFAFQSLQNIVGPIWSGVLQPLINDLMSLLGIHAAPTVTVKTDTTAIARAKSDIASIPGLEAGFGVSTGASSKVAGAAQSHAAKLADIAKKHADTIAKQHQALADKLKSIVEKSVESLRSAFQSAAQVDIGSMFASMQQQGETSADSLLASLKDRLAKIQQLAQDTAKLAGAGFSSLFIEKVVAQGPEVGDAMAQSILGASSKTQADLKTSFAQAVQLGAGQFVTGGSSSLNAKQLQTLATQGSTGQNVIGSNTGVTINAPVTMTSNASPAQTAQAVVSAIKFGVSAGAF